MKKPYQKLIVINGIFFLTTTLSSMLLLGRMSFFLAIFSFGLGWVHRLFVVYALIKTIKTFKQNRQDYLELLSVVIFAFDFIASIPFVGLGAFEVPGLLVASVGIQLITNLLLVFVLIASYQNEKYTIRGGKIYG